jgi:D-aminopeptidase
MSSRSRLRDIGISIDPLPPGSYNAITDVKGVCVGHTTLIHGDGALVIGRGPVRTGVTAILPHTHNLIETPVEAACYIFNGAGTSIGLSFIEEYGLINAPIILTNTLSVGTAYDAVVHYVRDTYLGNRIQWFNPVVGETYDGELNDILGLHIHQYHVLDALATAKGGPVTEGNIGAGTGTRAMGFKAGIGSASRQIVIESTTFTIGILVQSNFGGSLVINNVPVGRLLRHQELQDEGSIMIVLGTDAPLSHRQLRRVLKRAILGLTRTGWRADHGSGDYVIGFSTTYRTEKKSSSLLDAQNKIRNDEHYLNPLFYATAAATEEAILNSLLTAETMIGRDGNTRHALPIQQVEQICQSYVEKQTS